MKITAAAKNLRAFTLIELVISAAVGAMILAGAYLCLSASLASQKMIDPRVDVLQSARVAMAMIDADLRAATPLDKDFAFLGMHRAVGISDADNMDFATHNYTPRCEHEADYCETSYFVEQDPATGLLNLWRRRNPTLARDPLSGGRREQLARGLKGVRFDYTDGLDWYDSWGQTNDAKKAGLIAEDAVNLSGMPQAVRVTLSYPSSVVAAHRLDQPGSVEKPEAPLVFQSVVHLELADAAALPVAGGASSSSEQTPANGSNPNANPNGGQIPNGGQPPQPGEQP